jgi:EF-hand domain pair
VPSRADTDLSFFRAQDLDGTGKIRYTEFLAATIEARGAISEERLAEAFDRLDSDDSGFISAENLIEMLGKDFPRDQIDEIIQESSLHNDKQQISYAEFLNLWEGKHEQRRSQQLQMLGTEVMAFHRSDLVMNSFVGSTSDLLCSDSEDERESVEARSSFLLEKHDTKRVSKVDAPAEVALNTGEIA